MFQKIVLLLLFIVIGAVFYFSWLSDPSFTGESYLPAWLLNWSNQNYNLRTAVPFLALGFLLEVYTEHNGLNELNNENKKLNFIQNIVFAVIIVCVAEGGQFVIQSRNPDLADVFFGIAGSIIGAVSYNLLKKLKNAKQT